MNIDWNKAKILIIICYFTQSACETDISPCGDKGICIPNYQDDTVQCKCNDGFKGTPCGT